MIRKQIKDGNLTLFWKDKWLDNCSFCDKALCGIPLEHVDRYVNEYVSEDGIWKIDELKN